MSVVDSPAATQLKVELDAARAESDHLFGILTPDAFYERPISQRHRVLFYLGHLDGFDSIQICREGLGLSSPFPEFDTLFQAGIDPDGAHLPSDKPSDWPSLERIRTYARHSREQVDECLDRAPEATVNMAIEHRQMHLETLAYMFHNFDYWTKNVHQAVPLEREHYRAPENHWINIPAGDAVLGAAVETAFVWDNELRCHIVSEPEFRIQQNSVTNGDYLAYIEQTGAALPNFWVKRAGDIFYRGMFEEIPLPFDWPVYVTEGEAESYARFMGKDLPTEAQFHRAAYGTPDGGQLRYPWGDSAPDESRGNFNFRRWDPESVSASAEGRSAFDVNQLVGNGWQWTRTVFAPFPGFSPHLSYPGYSANFFDGEHNVIKGGSARTASRLLRRSFRNWFRRDYPYMYATFRCVENSR